MVKLWWWTLFQRWNHTTLSVLSSVAWPPRWSCWPGLKFWPASSLIPAWKETQLSFSQFSTGLDANYFQSLSILLLIKIRQIKTDRELMYWPYLVFYRVVDSFRRILAWYSFLIVSFGLGFYIMLHKDTGKMEEDNPQVNTLGKNFTFRFIRMLCHCFCSCNVNCSRIFWGPLEKEINFNHSIFQKTHAISSKKLRFCQLKLEFSHV